MNHDALQIAVDGGGAPALKLFLLLTVLSFAPALVVSVTAFTRVIVVLSFLRQGLGTPQLPPNPVLIGIAVFTSAFVMAPTLEQSWKDGVGPYLDGKMSQEAAFEGASVPFAKFMLPHTRPDDVQLFLDIGHIERPANAEEIPLRVLVPAFMVSELTTGFRMGLYILIPLLLVDLLVASVLMSLGMMMVPPNMVALPLKLAIFVAADGWRLVVAGLAKSFDPSGGGFDAG